MSEVDIDARIYATVNGVEQPLPEGCQWFAKCDNYANTVREHPAFNGGVPICKRCNDKLDGLT